MINFRPSFCSRLNLVYTDSKQFKSLYNSEAAQKSINELVRNGNDDLVTIIPDTEQDMGCSVPLLRVRVTENKNDKLYIGTSCVVGVNPDEIIKEYKYAKEKMAEIPDSPLKDYLV